MAKLLRVTAAAAVSVALATVIPGHAQQPPAGQAQGQAQPPQPAPADAQAAGQPVFRTGINFVRVDVIVSDRNGNPVGDLKPGDFEIVEQGKPQAIETFKLVSLDGGLMDSIREPPRQIRTDQDEESEAARDDVRLFAFFLDDYHVRLENGMQAREQLARFVQTQLGPSDMVGIMYPLEATAAVRMTRNHDAIMRGLQQFRGRKYDYTPRNELEERYAYYPTETVEKIRNQVSMSAMKALITHMGGLKEGRKALILVSEGYNAMLPPQMRDQNATVTGSGNSAAGDPFAGQNSIMEERAAFSSGMDMESDLRDLYDTANKNNVAIYAVDPRGLSTGEFGIDQNISQTIDRNYLNSTMETLRTLAINTDGRAIVNRNDLTMGMKQIIRDSSAYYLLGYNSTITATDGKFHEIRVRVKRPGVQVRARKGYWAFTNEDAKRALAPPRPEQPKAVDTAIAAIAAPSRSRLVRTWIGTERAASGKTRVTFVWEPVPRAPGDQARAGDTPVRMSVTAVAPDGSPYYRGKSPESLPTGSAGPAGGVVSFEAAPGKVQLRLAVESAGAEVLDSEVREIAVPDLTSPDVALATPEVFRARTVREFQQLKADPGATPTAAREFSRAERVFVRIATYGSGAGAPTLTARLLNRAGQSIADLPVAAASADGARDIDLALASLPVGEYLVEVTATGAGVPVKELIGFRITG
ncbi:MAG TPA: VWA domain-containing protein [Vicinamibacterales bacterium]|nr:VWA domain-containing protein [Vicinamibacterales bacterium]